MLVKALKARVLVQPVVRRFAIGGFSAAALAISVTISPAQQPGETFSDCEQCPEMVALPAGTFTMGLTPEERKHPFIGAVPADLPAHEVNIGYRFAIGKYEVTTAQFDAYVRETGDRTGGVCAIRLIEQGPNALKFTGTRHPGDTGGEFGPYLVYITDGSYAQPGLPVSPEQPAVCVSRLEIAGYLDWLSAKTGREYRLPSEAEWEYAARAGTRTIGFWGNDFAEACDYANFGDKRSGYQAGIAAPCAEQARHEWTAPVGSYKPNAWGIHDIAGNVQELTADCWHESYNGAPADGSPWTEPDCSLWVARGGDYEHMFVSMRAAERLFYGYVPEAGGVEGPDAGDNGRSNVGGFRVAVTLE
ncbi:formylglycine-generating enzyme family protein [Hoeflea sp. TYP-13]|uniref:formylglycine-generating enzyme family protein n=1 Tax=Hoeflea sp. TYP-13 TaxID=3230023 RepID=UPI0034C635BB